MSRPWTIALVQAVPATGADPVADLRAEVDDILAAHPAAQMVVFPEIHLHGACDAAPDANDWLAAAAEPMDGPLVRSLSRIAADHRVWLVPGSIAELGGEGQVYNTAPVFDPSGMLVAAYRKVFPYRPYETWTPGTEFVIFDVPEAGRFGLSICYDSWFPESTRQLAWLGAEVVLNLVKTTGPDRVQELVLARANAIVNQVYFLSVNAAGPPGWGHSVYVDPDGNVLIHEDRQGPALTVLDLDLERVSTVRTEGTLGINRLWEQLRDGDAPIPLPAYDGAMVPGRWNPARLPTPRRSTSED